MVNITQSIKQTGDAEFTVFMDVDGVQVKDIYTRSNAIFPAYHSLAGVLRELRDTTVHVVTNSAVMAREFNVLPNRHSRHLQELKDTVARRGIMLTIEQEQLQP